MSQWELPSIPSFSLDVETSVAGPSASPWSESFDTEETSQEKTVEASTKAMGRRQGLISGDQLTYLGPSGYSGPRGRYRVESLENPDRRWELCRVRECRIRPGPQHLDSGRGRLFIRKPDLCPDRLFGYKGGCKNNAWGYHHPAGCEAERL